MPKKIMIVDDEVNIRISLSDILKEEGFVVVQASGGAVALEMLDAEKPDLILLDTKMPEIDGIELCREIKQVRKIDTKIIVYTAKLDAIDAVRARENGTDDYCVKGRDPAFLIAMVHDLLGDT